jgi:hypothetical protein
MHPFEKGKKMKGVFFGLFIFLLGGILFVNQLWGLSIPLLNQGGALPLAIMFLALLSQLDAISQFKKITQLKLSTVQGGTPVQGHDLNPLSAENSAEARAQVLSFLGLLQEKGRLIDYAMEDIGSFSDQEVGAVGRLVHKGVREVLQSFFEIVPVRSEVEEALISINETDSPKTYRILGAAPKNFPFQGKVLHRGWKTNKFTPPKRLAWDDDISQKIITPAEIGLL